MENKYITLETKLMEAIISNFVTKHYSEFGHVEKYDAFMKEVVEFLIANQVEIKHGVYYTYEDVEKLAKEIENEEKEIK